MNLGVMRQKIEVGGHPAAVAQWQSTGGSSQRCPRLDSRRLPAFSLLSIFYRSKIVHESYSSHDMIKEQCCLLCIVFNFRLS